MLLMQELIKQVHSKSELTAMSLKSVQLVLNASGTGAADYTSIIIYPTIPGVKISGSLAAPIDRPERSG